MFFISPMPEPAPTTGKLQTYAQQWADTMVRIWTDRLDLMHIHHTGHLHRSVVQKGIHTSGGVNIAFQFVTYGLYVDAGTGRGYTPGNKGNLPFLNPVHRIQHHMGQPRKPRRWFSISWDISRKVFARYLSQSVQTQYYSLFSNLQ